MAIGAGVSIGATDIALRAGDKPILLGSNEVRDASKAWWNQAGEFTDGSGDESETGFNAVRTVDDFDHLLSKPNANQPTWHLMYEFTAADGVIDSVVILNHNLDSADAVVTVEIADNEDFDTNLKILEVQTPTTDKRLVFLDLDDTATTAITVFANAGGGQVTVTAAGHGLSENDAVTIHGTTSYNGSFTATNIAGNDFEITDGWVADDGVGFVRNDTDAGQLRYSSVQYARIKLTTLSVVPTIGEVIFSRRRQLKHKPEGQWDKSNLRSNTARFQSASGIISDYVFHKGQRRVSAQLSPHESAYINDLITFFETDLEYGTLPFILIDDPNSAQTDANWMKYETPEQISPLIGFSQRSFPLVAIEHGPNFLALGT